MQRFIDRAKNTNSGVGKLVWEMEGETRNVGKLIGLYNKLAPYMACPTIPNPFGEKK
ncbi:MAG: hypothetical protein ACPGUC_11280 [Gammaproteobacteria bacterium]